jgi:hypothetical protein
MNEASLANPLAVVRGWDAADGDETDEAWIARECPEDGDAAAWKKVWPLAKKVWLRPTKPEDEEENGDE